MLWSWKESGEEAHNIVHVNAPDSDVCISIWTGLYAGHTVTFNIILHKILNNK